MCLHLEMEAKPSADVRRPSLKKFQKAVKDVSRVARHTERFTQLASEYTDLTEIISAQWLFPCELELEFTASLVPR